MFGLAFWVSLFNLSGPQEGHVGIFLLLNFRGEFLPLAQLRVDGTEPPPLLTLPPGGHVLSEGTQQWGQAQDRTGVGRAVWRWDHILEAPPRHRRN